MLGLTYVNDEGQTIVTTPDEFAPSIDQIASVFPYGFTIYGATGEYAFEPTNVLEIVVPKCEFRKSLKKFTTLIDLYTVEFHQTGQFITVNKTWFLAK